MTAACIVSMPQVGRGGVGNPKCGLPVVDDERGLCAFHLSERERLL